MFGIICNNPKTLSNLFQKNGPCTKDDIAFFDISSIYLHNHTVNAFILQKNNQIRFLNIKIPKILINLSSAKKKYEKKTLKMLQKIYNYKIFNPVNKFNQNMIYDIVSCSPELKRYLLAPIGISDLNKDFINNLILSNKRGVKFISAHNLINIFDYRKYKDSVIYKNPNFSKEDIIKVFLIRKTIDNWKIINIEFNSNFKLLNPSKIAIDIAAWISNYIPYLFCCTISLIANSPDKVYLVHFAGINKNTWEE